MRHGRFSVFPSTVALSLSLRDMVNTRCVAILLRIMFAMCRLGKHKMLCTDEKLGTVLAYAISPGILSA